eukprot:Skav208799  [mRNA]  locus=scaffold478:128623:133526:- [translate_table: standard]
MLGRRPSQSETWTAEIEAVSLTASQKQSELLKELEEFMEVHEGRRALSQRHGETSEVLCLDMFGSHGAVQDLRLELSEERRLHVKALSSVEASLRLFLSRLLKKVPPHGFGWTDVNV